MQRIDDYKTAISLAAAELQSQPQAPGKPEQMRLVFQEDGREGLLVPYFGQAPPGRLAGAPRDPGGGDASSL